MFEQFIEFWKFDNPNVIWVLLGASVLGALSGVVGSFTFLRKRALIGDVLAHASLPGVTTAFILFQTRDPLTILGGATLSCFLGYFCTDYLINHTKIKEDSALAIVLSLFFAVGVFQLTYIQKQGNAAQAGLDKLLFGQAAGLIREDVILLSALGAFVLLVVVVFLRQLKTVSFDRNFAHAVGLNTKFYEFLMALILVLAVVLGLQLVGVVLMAAILMTAPAAARYWTNSLSHMLFISAIFGAVSGIAGANISYLAPHMPTGPWIVVVLTLIFVVSFSLAPNKGIIPKIIRRIKFSRKINDENILRTIYKVAEDRNDKASIVDSATILTYRNMLLLDMERAVSRLISRNYLEKKKGGLVLTPKGLERAEQVTRFHRLWELYLTKYINIPEDHVHDQAEEIEHFITPELEQFLMSELGEAVQDPHGKAIPHDGKSK